MCGINYKNIPSNFVNCYITEDYHCYLVFDKTEDYDEIFYHFMQSTIRNNNKLVSYDDLEDEVVFIFKIPEIFKDEFDIFIRGAYSEFSEAYKKILVSFYGQISIKDSYEASVFNTIYPENFKRKQIAEHLSYKDSQIDWRIVKEVLHKPDLEKEIFISLNTLLEQHFSINKSEDKP